MPINASDGIHMQMDNTSKGFEAAQSTHGMTLQGAHSLPQPPSEHIPTHRQRNLHMELGAEVVPPNVLEHGMKCACNAIQFGLSNDQYWV